VDCDVINLRIGRCLTSRFPLTARYAPAGTRHISGSTQNRCLLLTADDRIALSFYRLVSNQCTGRLELCVIHLHGLITAALYLVRVEHKNNLPKNTGMNFINKILKNLCISFILICFFKLLGKTYLIFITKSAYAMCLTTTLVLFIVKWAHRFKKNEQARNLFPLHCISIMSVCWALHGICHNNCINFCVSYLVRT
jgi:hypothetical protein